MEEEYFPLAESRVFKEFFLEKDGQELLKDFLREVLGQKIESIEILNPEILENYEKDKEGVIFLKARLENKRIIEIKFKIW